MSRAFATATSLTSGRVLIAGGVDSNYRYLPNVELYNAATRTFTALSPMTTGRAAHTATLLPGGAVLIVGGTTCVSGVCHKLASAEVFDPISQGFLPVGNLVTARAGHTATLLGDGTVLIAGGVDDEVIPSAEIFDPATARFTETATLISPRFMHSATLLLDGQVLLTGGRSCVDECEANPASKSAELYDPGRRQFFPAGTMRESRILHNSTLLPDGRVLISGGRSCIGDCEGDKTLQNTEIYDPGNGSFVLAANMSTARASHRAIALPDGRIFIYGGAWCSRRSGCSYLNSGELFQPDTETFIPATSGTVAGVNSVAALLPNQEVLIAGGRMRGSILRSADVFSF
ncbi:MAG: kelch repeat-containing protein [Candidatus Binatus sp.]|uniref:Kelch repeat-containing protein n=1 Tax=Candidatus Binatus sp. TaxID=2811406 RepID=UPI0027187908|nr:kelch repeat-containing protein [Candidatus Binatus sp.]MDO8432700.1 kelch repeat-containing protein [Candidatus Binatus sp.]